MKIKLLGWDSDFFKMKVGLLLFNNDVIWDDSEIKNWDLVYIFVDQKDMTHNLVAQAKKIPLVDEKVTYVMNLKKFKTHTDPSPKVHKYYSSVRDHEVIRIGIQSGIYSRFCVDPMFPPEKCKELYSIWIEKSISREIAKEVYVFENGENEIAGVITLGEKNNRADIGILAVDEKFRGQNVGSEIVNEAIHYSLQNNYPALQVVTQKRNLSACVFYQRCGFSQEQVINIYHFWKKNYDSVQ